MEKLLQPDQLSPEIRQLLDAIAEQHRLMVEMEENLHRLEHDLAAARHFNESTRPEHEETELHRAQHKH
ncbi:MAG TPA: hypothetical protein VKS79_03415 [Gemmataceae bacterium]|nr:hypothetical protein [Gemmataceae bacterium]